MRRDLIILALVIAVNPLWGYCLNRVNAPYLLEDGNLETSACLVPHERICDLWMESSVEEDWHKAYGCRLSMRGEWSLAVGDKVARFDEALGFPSNVQCRGHGKVRAFYHSIPDDFCDGFWIYADVDVDNERVTRIAVARHSLQSIHIPVKPWNWEGPLEFGFLGGKLPEDGTFKSDLTLLEAIEVSASTNRHLAC